MSEHRARRLDNGEWIVGKYELVANTYHVIGAIGEGDWEEIDIKTLEEV